MKRDHPITATIVVLNKKQRTTTQLITNNSQFANDSKHMNASNPEMIQKNDRQMVEDEMILDLVHLSSSPHTRLVNEDTLQFQHPLHLPIDTGYYSEFDDLDEIVSTIPD